MHTQDVIKSTNGDNCFLPFYNNKDNEGFLGKTFISSSFDKTERQTANKRTICKIVYLYFATQGGRRLDWVEAAGQVSGTR